MEEVNPRQNVYNGMYGGNTHHSATDYGSGAYDGTYGGEFAGDYGRPASPHADGGDYGGGYGGNGAHNDFGSTTSLPQQAGGIAGAHDSDSDTHSVDPNAPQYKKFDAPWYVRRWFLTTLSILGLLGIVLLFVILYPLINAIAQYILNKTEIYIDHALITNPSNSSFDLLLQGNIFKTSVFYAEIDFHEPINVSWVENTNSIVPLGYMTLHKVYADHGRAPLNDSTTFYITDQPGFGRFAQTLIGAQNFTWRLECDSLTVQAEKFPKNNGLRLKKDVTLGAINNFDGAVVLQDLLLPGTAPGGGIEFQATTILNNKSPFELALGDLTFDLGYDGMALGTGTAKSVSLVAGNNTITLNGALQPKTAQTDLDKLSILFTNYLNGNASDVTATGNNAVYGADGAEIGWLSEGLRGLNLHVPFKPLAPINPIRSIDVGDLGLTFTEETAWEPAVLSNSVIAAIQLPFGFPISISEIQNDFNLSQDLGPVAGLTTPLGASTSNITVLSSTNTQGTVNITLGPGSKLISTLPQHAGFSALTTQFTNNDTIVFNLAGKARTRAVTPVGTITLDPIMVNVSTSLKGLQGLKNLVTINSIDVTGGTTEHLNLIINTTVNNPAQFTLKTTTTNLQLSRGGEVLGVTTLANLTLNHGTNIIPATSTFNPNAGPIGMETLTSYIAGNNSDLVISGYDGSTDVASLLQALETLNVSVLLPGLKTPLLSSAALKVLPASTPNGQPSAQASVVLVNPFTSALQINSIQSNVTSYGLNLGTINTNAGFTAPGKTTYTSPELALDLNLDPSTLFTLTRKLAVDAGLPTAQLDGIVQLGGYSYLDGTVPSKRALEARDNLYTGFNLPDFISKAFANLKGDVGLTAGVTIGQYQTSLTYVQNAVPVKTDSSILLLINTLALPIVQKLVAGVNLGVDTVLINNPAQESFGTSLTGSITNAGPFDAAITFPGSGLNIAWNGQKIGSLNLDKVNVVGDVGATLDTTGTFTVASVPQLTEFTKTLLTTESFSWDISADNLTVEALGIAISGIALPTKTVTLRGFNGLKGDVTIQSFDLPSNDPNGGIHLTIQSTVNNPSQVGISLSSIAFEAFYDGVDLGPVASDGALTLSPSQTSPLSLAGRLVPQSGDNLNKVSTLFNNFVQGQDTIVSVTGRGAGDGSVTWLQEGIQALNVQTVLPNQGKLNVIKSIDLNQLTIDFTQDTAYSPSASSSDTVAAFTFPFGFPVDITQLTEKLTTGSDGQDFGTLDIPTTQVRTDVGPRIVHISFSDIPLVAYARDIFRSFLSKATNSASVPLDFSGTANAVASTAIGAVTLSNLAFDVSSPLAGLQGLTSRPVTVANLDVARGFRDYLLINIDTTLYNPSNLTVGAGDVSFDLQFQGKTIGQAILNNVVITPGEKTYATSVHYEPQGDAVPVGAVLLANYITGVESTTAIHGTQGSTPIDSLKDALSQINISPVNIPASKIALISSAALQFPTDILTRKVASTEFTITNPFTAGITLKYVKANVSYFGLDLGGLDTGLDFHVNGHTTGTSAAVPFNFNLDPDTIISLIQIAANNNGVDLGPLTQLILDALSHPGAGATITSSIDPNPATCSSGQQFDVNGAILAALKGLKVDLDIQSTTVDLDEYETQLSFKQEGLTTDVDRSALYLIGAVAPPIISGIVNGSQLAVKTATVTNLADDGFDIALDGSLTNLGPLDALVTFVEPLTVTWEGHDIATIQLPDACSAANVGLPQYQPKGRLRITDLDQFTAFATKLLATEEFTWTLSTTKLRVTALGTIFDNVPLSKDVTLKGFNGLPGVSISNFQLPGDSPQGGIQIETDSNIPSPAQLGITLGTVNFEAYYKGVLLGPLSGTGLTLPPNGNVTEHLSGRIQPQSDANLDTIGELFTSFLSGEQIPIVAKGVSVSPNGDGSTVSWLSAAFKTLNLPVTLAGQKFNVITGIAIGDLNLELINASEDYAPLATSKSSSATYKNPFGFSLQVISNAVNLTLGFGGTDAARLLLPLSNSEGGVSTGNDANLPISFTRAPLQSINNGAFQNLLRASTDEASAELSLSGLANVVARTSIGNVPINNLPFTNVKSVLKGINGFGGKTSLGPIDIKGSGGDGGNQYVTASVTTTLDNPSDITLDTVDVSLPVLFSGTKIGRAVIKEFDLKTGTANYDTEFRYQPDNANDATAQGFLTQFLTSSDTLAVTIQGDAQSSPFDSLVPALEGLKLAAGIPGLGLTLITEPTAYTREDSITAGNVDLTFKLTNPFDTPLYISHVSGSAVPVEDPSFTLSTFDTDIQFTVPAKSSATSDKFFSTLPNGVFGSLTYIIPGQRVNIAAKATVNVGGPGGYQIPSLSITENNVEIIFNLEFGASLKQQLNSTSSSTASTLSSSGSVTLPSTSAAPTSAPPESAAPATSTPKESSSPAAAPRVSVEEKKAASSSSSATPTSS